MNYTDSDFQTDITKLHHAMNEYVDNIKIYKKVKSSGNVTRIIYAKKLLTSDIEHIRMLLMSIDTYIFTNSPKIPKKVQNLLDKSHSLTNTSEYSWYYNRYDEEDKENIPKNFKFNRGMLSELSLHQLQRVYRKIYGQSSGIRSKKELLQVLFRSTV